MQSLVATYCIVTCRKDQWKFPPLHIRTAQPFEFKDKIMYCVNINILHDIYYAWLPYHVVVCLFLLHHWKKFPKVQTGWLKIYEKCLNKLPISEQNNSMLLSVLKELNEWMIQWLTHDTHLLATTGKVLWPGERITENPNHISELLEDRLVSRIRARN